MMGGAFGFLFSAAVAAPSHTYATFNPADKYSTITLSNGNLSAAGTEASAWRSARANIGKSGGKAVFEITTSNGAGASGFIRGFGDVNSLLSTYIGAGGISAGTYNTGYTRSNVTGDTTALAISTTAMLALDLTAGKGWLKMGGTWASGDPATGTTPTFIWAAGTLIYPTISFFDTASVLTLNAGASAFTYPVPTGFDAGWYTG